MNRRKSVRFIGFPLLFSLSVEREKVFIKIGEWYIRQNAQAKTILVVQ